MKHKIKKYSHWTAGCENPGCMANIEGGIVEDMTQKDLDDFFKGECPYVFNPDKRSMTHEESVDYLLKRAKKEINDWERLIDFWEKNETHVNQNRR